ncbi:N-acetylmuramoyl-L-alanine amidase [Hyphobacterium sp. HN65]|uniref:N-acetylmuramoyl-L-alanine amidase n=1 Tax=Hyphobacterium lacteum TaxID=3116575 RepID=A0ABU7LLQ9_9PROT|nr:N-acetylmuramoyl-L-alanine amidase [Hyphobacterium sp. HN65]MEE2524817.1 N-acetylmuramoyl-L-alanine amidase [Hyphobacterium sp. HN65]
MALIAAFASFAPAVAIDGSEIRQVRFGGGDDETRVVVELSTDIEFRAFTVSEPTRRLVLDISRAAWSVEGLETGEGLGFGLVDDFRFFDRSAEASRLVFELESPAVIVNQFDIPANADNPHHRLVIDLRRVEASEFEEESGFPEPSDLSQLIAERGDATFAEPERERRVIVIDAGHGGHDPGASANGVVEETINLAAALELRRRLVATGRYDVIMTRDSDHYLTLQERVNVARAANADLFISLHADSAGAGSSARGAAVYTLSDSGAGRASRLPENASDWNHLSGGTQPPVVRNILLSLSLREKRNRSAIFAEMVLDSMSEVGPVLTNGHRQRGFYVLLDSQVPAVLVEMGFLTNRDDAANLNSAAYRARLMQSLAEAVDDYFDRDDVSDDNPVRSAQLTPIP